MLRKGLITGILIAACALSFAGCKGGNNASKETDENGLAYVELKMVYPVSANATGDQQAVTDKINEYLKEKINCTVDIEALDTSTFYQKLPVMISSSENFDIAWINSGTLLQNVSRNAFVQLDDLLDKYAPETKAILPDVLLDGVRVNNKLYSLPVYKEYGYGNSYYFRKDIVDKYNFDLTSLKTMRDFEPMLETIKNNESQISPFFTESGAMEPYMPAVEGEKYYFNVAGLPMSICYDPVDDKFVNRIETEEYKNKCKIYNEWNKKGYINKDAITVSATFDEIIKGNRGWFVTTSSKPGVSASLTKSTGKEMICGYSEKAYVNTSSVMGSMNAISITSKNPERAMMLMNLLYTDKYLINLFNFGIEGKHYEKVDENTIKLPDGIATQADTKYAPGVDWRLGNNYNLYVWDYEDPDKWEQYKKFSEDAEPEPLLGFYVDTSEIKDSIAAINNLSTSYDLPLIVGVGDAEETIAQYAQKLKEAGIEKVIAETQKQYEAWKSSK